MLKKYGNLETLNLSVIFYPELRISNVKTFGVGMRVYSVLIFNENVRSLRNPYRAVVK